MPACAMYSDRPCASIMNVCGCPCVGTLMAAPVVSTQPASPDARSTATRPPVAPATPRFEYQYQRSALASRAQHSGAVPTGANADTSPSCLVAQVASSMVATVNTCGATVSSISRAYVADAPRAIAVTNCRENASDSVHVLDALPPPERGNTDSVKLFGPASIPAHTSTSPLPAPSTKKPGHVCTGRSLCQNIEELEPAGSIACMPGVDRCSMRHSVPAGV
mmetsp:Transcript_21634/g.76002  ORF Transcript_21634/g.76002 Transcript_21634/m.76002 type:complete len:221 (-) Transcript_21634:58-720(-)